MKIAFICSGVISVPPASWGAVEILVWEYYSNLVKNGHEVEIFNTKDLESVKKAIEKNKFDFVHLQNEDYLPFFENIQTERMAVTAHCGWADMYINYEPYYWKTFKSIIDTRHYNFSLSEGIKNNYINFGANKDKIYITKNGVNTSLFSKDKQPYYRDRSIFLGRFERRKQQHKVSNKNLNIDFAGFGQELQLSETNKILGIWSKEECYKNLTKYPNLILLSESEAHPLVCMEALAAGCGLVITEKCSANLDINKNFISIINDDVLENPDHNMLKEIIENNREISVNSREEIIEYSKTFEWSKVVSEYEKILEKIK
jgi:glycosyltransferase involved in cell wall biosynthesis